MNKLLFCLLIAGLGMIGCKTTEEATSAANLKKRSVKFLLNKLKKNHIEYDWFSARSKVQYEDAEQSISFMAYLRIKKDSIVWLSVKKLGITAARVRITPQKFEFVNYLGREHLSQPFSALKSNFNLDLSFGDLQDLLVGNPILLEGRKLDSKVKEKKHVLHYKEKGMEVSLILGAKNFLIEGLEGEMDKNILEASFGDYREVQGRKIAHSKKLDIDSEQTGLVELKMNFSKIELDIPKKTKYNVPSGYKEVKILSGL